MSSIMAPIQALTKKGVDVQATWDEKIHGVAFEALKIALTSAPILKIPDINKPFKLETDACRVGRGIGAILSQEDDEGILRPCQYWSRALSNAERRYSATELECLALHDSILHWKVYLSNGHQFECIVDHYALVFMVTRMASSEQTNQRLLRLCLDLQGFNFKVTHRAGIRHIGADAVSRLLRHGEEAYVRNVDDLRDDIGPLTELDIQRLHTEYSQDAWFIIQTINEHRKQEQELRLEQESSVQNAIEDIKTHEHSDVNDIDTAIQCHMCQEDPNEPREPSEAADSQMEEDEFARAWLDCKDTDEMIELFKQQSPTKTVRVVELNSEGVGVIRSIGENERDTENIVFRREAPHTGEQIRRMRHSQECTEALHGEVSKLVRTQQSASERGRHYWFNMQRQMANEQAVQRELSAASSDDEAGQDNQLPMNSSQYRKYVQAYPVSNPQWSNEQLMQMAKFRVEERLRKQQGDDTISINMVRLWNKPTTGAVNSVTPDNQRQPAVVTPADTDSNRGSGMTQRFMSSDGRCMTRTQLQMMHQQGPRPMAALGPDHNPSRCLCRADEGRASSRDRNNMCVRCGVTDRPQVVNPMPARPVCDSHRVDYYNKNKARGRHNEHYWKGKWMQATAQQRRIESDRNCSDQAREAINHEAQKCYYMYSKQRQENKRAEQLFNESQQRLDRTINRNALSTSPAAKRTCTQPTPPRMTKISTDSDKQAIAQAESMTAEQEFTIAEQEFEYRLPSKSEREQTDQDLVNTFGRRIGSRAQLKQEICQAVQLAGDDEDIRDIIGNIVMKNIDDAIHDVEHESKAVTTEEMRSSGKGIPDYLLGDGEQCGAAYISRSLKKRLASYSTEALEVALQHTKIVSHAKEDIQTELTARQYRKDHPRVGYQPTQQLHKELNKLHASFVEHGWTSAEIAKVTSIENELLRRGERNRQKRYDNVCAEVLQDRQFTLKEQHEAVKAKARKILLGDDSRGAPHYNMRNVIREDIERYQANYRQWQADSTFHVELPENTFVNEAVEYINTLNNNTRIAVERKVNHIKCRLHEANEGRGRVRVDVSSGDIIIHALTQDEKRQLSDGSRSQLTEVEQAAKARLALIQQKNAQQQILKLQEKKQSATKKLQQATEARLKRANALEAELKLLSRSRPAAGEEFQNEEEEYLIDKRLEDECDCLISQHFLCPATAQLYEIIDVKMEKMPNSQQKQMMAVARPINSTEIEGDHILRTKTFPITDVTHWVNRFVAGKRSYEDTPIPTSDAEWTAVQSKDLYCRRIMDTLGLDPNNRYALDDQPPAASEDYLYRTRLADGTLSPLYRRYAKNRMVETHQATVNIAQHVVQKVIPASLADKIIWIMHDQMGHPGRNRTLETIRLKFYWPGMYTSVSNYCKECHYCALRKANNRVAKVPIMSYDFSERPNSRVHFDTAGPFPLSNSGSHYILVLKDALTKWVTLIPAYSKDMYTVQKMYLEHWTSKFGAPDVLITDRGSEFHNVVAKQLAELWGVRKVSTTPRNPRADGQAENQMRTIKDMLQSYINSNQQDWDEHLSLVAQAYNNTVNDATGMTPHYLLFGTEMNTAGEEHVQRMSVKDFHDTVHRVKEVQQWLWSYVGNRVVTNTVKFNRVPAERLQFKPYEHGDFFYLRVVPKRVYKNEREEKAHQISAKLQYRYTGPYMVYEQLSPVLYTSFIHGKLKRCHAINMKPANKTTLHKKPNATGSTRTSSG